MFLSSAMSSLSQWTRWSISKRSLSKISFAPRSKKDVWFYHGLSFSKVDKQYPKAQFSNQKTGGVTLEEEDIVVSNVKINWHEEETNLFKGKNNDYDEGNVHLCILFGEFSTSILIWHIIFFLMHVSPHPASNSSRYWDHLSTRIFFFNVFAYHWFFFFFLPIFMEYFNHMLNSNSVIYIEGSLQL